MAIEADEMPVVGRLTRIRGVLLELSEMLETRGTDGLREEHAVNILKLVVKWPRDPTDQRGLLDAHKRFLKGMGVYERGAQNTKSKARLKGYVLQNQPNVGSMRAFGTLYSPLSRCWLSCTE